MKSTKFFTLIAASVLVMTGCGQKQVHQMNIKGDQIVGVGEKVTFTTDAAGEAVAWSSSNEAVATVDANGKVTGRAPGLVEIKAVCADHGASAVMTIEVGNRSFERSAAAGWKAAEVELMEDALYDVVLPYMAFGDDYTMVGSSSSGSESTIDTITIKDTFKADLTAEYADLLVQAGFVKTEEQTTGNPYYVKVNAKDSTYVYVSLKYDFHNGNKVVAIGDFDAARYDSWPADAIAKEFKGTGLPRVPEIEKLDKYVYATFKIGDEFIVQTAVTPETTEEKLEKFKKDCAAVGIYYYGYSETYGYHQFIDFKEDVLMIAMLAEYDEYGLFMLDLIKIDDPAILLEEFPVDEVNAFVGLDQESVATDGIATFEDVDGAGFKAVIRDKAYWLAYIEQVYAKTLVEYGITAEELYDSKGDSYWPKDANVTVSFVDKSEDEVLAAVADYGVALKDKGYTLYTEGGIIAYAISANKKVVVEFEFDQCVFAAKYTAYVAPVFNKQAVTDAVVTATLNQYVAAEGTDVVAPFDDIDASKKVFGYSSTYQMFYMDFYTPFVSVAEDYVTALENNGWAVAFTAEDGSEFMAVSADLQIELEGFYDAEYQALEVQFGEAINFGAWPTVRVAAAVAAVVETEVVLPEFEALAAEWQIVDATFNGMGFDLYGMFVRKAEAAAYADALAADTTNWVEDVTYAEDLEEGIAYGAYHSVDEKLCVQVTFDLQGRYVGINVTKYVKFEAEWNATGIAAMLEAVYCADVLPAYAPIQGMTNEYGLEQGAKGAIVYIKADEAKTETTDIVGLNYLQTLTSEDNNFKAEILGDTMVFVSPNKEYYVMMTKDELHKAVKVETYRYNFTTAYKAKFCAIFSSGALLTNIQIFMPNIDFLPSEADDWFVTTAKIFTSGAMATVVGPERAVKAYAAVLDENQYWAGGYLEDYNLYVYQSVLLGTDGTYNYFGVIYMGGPVTSGGAWAIQVGISRSAISA